MRLLQDGQQIDGARYVVERFLGEGAFAEVYRVRHEYLGRQALKVFRGAGMTRDEIESVLEEALVLSKLGHPNVVRVFDASTLVTDHGTCGYFTMEYVAGGNLERFWKSHGARFVPVATTLQLVSQVCGGLKVAHGESPPIVHRDIKPQNILVGYDADGVRARVSDFGLAKRVHPTSLLASARGTLAFKAPETFASPGSDSCAGDVWAIGTLAYLLLTDQLPYSGVTELELVGGTRTGAAFDRPVLAPSQLNLDVDPQLDRIVLKALAPDPHDRYPDAAAMLVDLAALTTIDRPATVTATATAAGPGPDGPGGRARRSFAELLTAQATPEVLRDNPFRVVGLPTDAANQQLRRQAERIRRDPDVPARQAERVEAALRRLRDPIQRLVDELLWTWPDEADADTGHNAAVRALLHLVEADGDAADAGAAIDAMAGSLRAPATAAHVAARAASLDDPRVAAPGAARQLLDEAQRVVPLVALRMSARAHDAGDADVAAALAAAVRTHAGAEIARVAAATVVEPAIGRVRTLVDAAERESRSDRERGADRAARLLRQTAADRALIDMLLDEADPRRVGIVDRMVDQLVGDVVAAFDETDDERTALDLLHQASDLRPGPALAARIERNLTIIRDQAEQGRCWFCQAAPSDPAATVEIDLHGNVHRDHQTGKVTWGTTKLAVPRCSSCATRQQRRDSRGCSIGAGTIVLGAAVVGGVLAAAAGHPLAIAAAVTWLVVSIFIGVVTLVVVGRDTRRRIRQFPPLQRKLAGGWAFGTSPPGAQR